MTKSGEIKPNLLKTEIVINQEADMPYGYCAIPPRFFERMLERQRKNTMQKTILSIRARDGRELLTVES